MRIAIDARHDEAGPGRYTFSLIRELARLDQQNQYTILLRREKFDSFRVPGPNFQKVLADFHWFTVAEQLRLPVLLRRNRPDIVHFPHFNVPVLLGCPFVVTIHDLDYSHFRAARPGVKGQLKHLVKSSGYSVTLQKLKLARAVITPSQYSKADIVKELKFDPRRVFVTYEGADPTELGKPDPATLKRYRITDPFFLYVGAAYPKKNLGRLIEAFATFTKKHPDYQLVLAGNHAEFATGLKAEAARLKLGDRVIFPGRVSDPELAALYRGALGYAFVSLSEGFGLPGLEAMAEGLPVLAARASCLPEVYGDAAHYVDPESTEDIAAGLQKIATDQKLRQNLIAKGHQQVGKYSWAKMAKETLEVYEQAAKK